MYNGVPVPGFSAALAYYDALRADRLPAALVQGLRDFFGAHTYRRTDADGSYHTLWAEDRSEVMRLSRGRPDATIGMRTRRGNHPRRVNRGPPAATPAIPRRGQLTDVDELEPERLHPAEHRVQAALVEGAGQDGAHRLDVHAHVGEGLLGRGTDRANHSDLVVVRAHQDSFRRSREGIRAEPWMRLASSRSRPSDLMRSSRPCRAA